jgi:hypothetical protein
MGRTVIVGDVHGCASELDALLDRIAFARGDRLIFVGDLIARGPDSVGVLAIARQTGAVIVRGNHEDKLLRWRQKKKRHAKGRGKRPEPLGPIHAEVARSLTPADWAMLASSVHHHDLPEHRARVVHAGVHPRVPFELQDPQTLMRIRCVDARGDWMEKGGATPWGRLYAGPPHILFGHNALPDPQLHRWATGLDTACVYGGRLTAMVLAPGEAIPRGSAAARLLVTQSAFRAYYAGKKSAAWASRRVA